MLLERHKLVGHSMWGGALISSLLGNDLPGPGTVYLSQSFEFHNVGGARGHAHRHRDRNVQERRRNRAVRLSGGQPAGRERSSPASPRVKAPTRKPAEGGSPYAAMQLHRKTAFKRLIDHVKDWERIPVAVCHPCSKEALQGAIDAAEAGLIDPVLVGPGGQNPSSWPRSLRLNIQPYRLVDALHSHDSAAKAVALCRSGRMRGAHERQPAHRRADGCGRALGDRAAHRAADQPCVRHGCAHLPAAAVHHRCGHQHLPQPWRTRSTSSRTPSSSPRH